MLDVVKIVALGALTLAFAMAANFGTDPAYQLHAVILMLVSGGMMIWTIRNVGRPSGLCRKLNIWTM